MGPALTVLPLVLAVAALVLTTSCSPPDREPAPEPAAEPSVSVELVQYRRDEALHQLQVKVTNAGTREVVLDRLRVGLPGFADVPPSDPGAALAPGRRVDLPVVYGAARCQGDRPASSGEPAVVSLHVDGASEPVELHPTGGDLLSRLATRECAQRAVTEAVPLALTDAWVQQGSGNDLVVAGVLRAGPAADGTAAALAVLDGTTLFGITAGTPLPIDLGGAAVDVPVTVAPQRCDPHAVAESKRGYAFRVGMALDGAEPVLVTVDVEPEQRPVLEAALLERCGLG